MAAQTHLDNWKALLEAIRDDNSMNFRQKVAVLHKTSESARDLFRLIQSRDRAEVRFNITISNADIADELNAIINQSNIVEDV